MILDRFQVTRQIRFISVKFINKLEAEIELNELGTSQFTRQSTSESSLDFAKTNLQLRPFE